MKRLSILILALAAAAPALATQAGPVLLRAKGPIAMKLAAGKPLPAARLTLQQGDVLMLLDGKGVRTLAGPGTFENGAFTRTGPRAGTAGQRIGAVRGVGGERPALPAAADPGSQQWVVPLADIGTVCLPADRELALWKRAGSASTIEVQPAASGAARSIAWPANSAQVAWPQDLSTASGTKYRLTSQAFGTREIEFRALSADDPACAPQIEFNIQLAAEATEPAVNAYLN